MILLADKQGTTLYAVVLHQDGWDRGMRREFVLQSVCATPESEVSVLGASGELQNIARIWMRTVPYLNRKTACTFP